MTYQSFEQVQADRQAHSDAISTALAGVDKGEHGIRHHRYVETVEYVRRADGIGIPVHDIEWCWDCGRPREEAEQVPTPSNFYSDHPALGFCGYTAQQPGT